MEAAVITAVGIDVSKSKAQLRHGDPEAKSYFGLSRSTTRTVT